MFFCSCFQFAKEIVLEFCGVDLSFLSASTFRFGKKRQKSVWTKSWSVSVTARCDHIFDDWWLMTDDHTLSQHRHVSLWKTWLTHLKRTPTGGQREEWIGVVLWVRFHFNFFVCSTFAGTPNCAALELIIGTTTGKEVLNTKSSLFCLAIESLPPAPLTRCSERTLPTVERWVSPRWYCSHNTAHTHPHPRLSICYAYAHICTPTPVLPFPAYTFAQICIINSS
jgi:hypothetical protein